jgi:hypothetical protein
MSSSEKINILTLDVLTNTISLIGKERFSDYFFKNINYTLDRFHWTIDTDSHISNLACLFWTKMWVII